MIYQRCKLCGTRSDSYGCYDTCRAEGPFHEWGDFLVESDIVDAGARLPSDVHPGNFTDWRDWAAAW